MAAKQPQLPPYAEPLEDDEIRLFRLRERSDGSISLEIKTFSLGYEHLSFVATSYVWGDAKDTCDVLVNGYPMPILRSAHTLFQAMLSPYHRGEFPPASTWWWMDCICINQRDLAERSAQVRSMSDIYELASRTVIWLGDESEDSHRAMEFLEDMRVDRGTISEILENKRGWKAVENLLARTWWERVWTLQEFLMGHNATFFCGKKTMSLRHMNKAIHRVWDWHQYRNNLIAREGYEKAWNRLRLLEWHKHYRGKPCLPPIAVMTYTATFSGTDPRDRLYSILGLISLTDRKIIGRPDYESPPRTVYARFARSFIEVYQCLDIICIAPEMKTNVQAGENPDGLGLPSWIPDWSIRRNFSPPVLCMASQSATTFIGNFRPLHSKEYTCAYRASGSKEPMVFFSEDGLRLTCTGFLLDEIDGLGGGNHIRETAADVVQSSSPLNSPSGRQDRLLPEGAVTISKEVREACSIILEKMSRCLSLDRRDPYLNLRAPQPHFARECQRLGRLAYGRPERVPSYIFDWFQTNKHLEIKKLTVLQVVLHGEIIRNPAEPQEINHKLGRMSLDDEDDVEEKKQNEYDGGSDENRKTFGTRCREVTLHRGRRLMVTTTGILGMAPKEARKGDLVCILLGCNIPVVLRPIPGGEQFRLVGECYVDGYMRGEVIQQWKDGKRSLQPFSIV